MTTRLIDHQFWDPFIHLSKFGEHASWHAQGQMIKLIKEILIGGKTLMEKTENLVNIKNFQSDYKFLRLKYSQKSNLILLPETQFKTHSYLFLFFTAKTNQTFCPKFPKKSNTNWLCSDKLKNRVWIWLIGWGQVKLIKTGPCVLPTSQQLPLNWNASWDFWLKKVM